MPLAEEKADGVDDVDITAKFDHIVLEEDIREGERVRAYVLEAKMADQWSPIAKRSGIGHNRIHKLTEPVTAGKIRLRIKASTSEAIISRLAIYLADEAKAGRQASPSRK